MVEYWNVDAKKNFPINHYPNIPKPNIPSFQTSIIPIVSEAN